MSNGYIPANDEKFARWSEQFKGYAGNHSATIGLTEADITVLDGVGVAWETKYTTYVNKQVEAKGSRDMKTGARKEYEAVIRPMVARIQACPTTTDADRQGLGITVRGAGAGSGGAIIPSEDRPTAVIDISTRFKHVLRIGNQTNTGITKGKPAGVIACEICRKIGDAPADESELTTVGFATRSPFTVSYPMEDGGKQVYYMLRWVNSKGEKSSWSDTESATIAA